MIISNQLESLGCHPFNAEAIEYLQKRERHFDVEESSARTPETWKTVSSDDKLVGMARHIVDICKNRIANPDCGEDERRYLQFSINEIVKRWGLE